MKHPLIEEVTQEEQILLRDLFDAMPQLGWRARADGFIDYYNQGWYQYTGTSPAQMEGWGWTSVHDPAHLPRVLKEWKLAIATGQAFEAEFPLRRYDGEFRWFLTRVLPIRDGDGRLVRWVGINTDIHDQRLAAEKLNAQRARYHAMFSQAPVAIALLRGPTHVVELANPLICGLWGRDLEEALDKPIMDVLPELRGQGFDRLLDEVYRTGVAFVGKELPVKLDRGGTLTTIYVDFVYEALRDDHGAIEGIVAVAVDVTAQVVTRGQLVQQNRHSRFAAEVGAALTSNMPMRSQLNACCEAVVRLGAAFARIWIHNEAEEVLELEASAGLYTHLDGGHARVPVGQFKIGLIASERQPHLTNAVLDDPRVSDPDWARREGMVAFAGYPLMLGERLIGVLAMFSRDALSEGTFDALGTVADQLALSIERAMNKRFREMFIAMLGHDLRNPLSAIQTGAEVLTLDSALPKRPRQTAARIIKSSARMSRMVDQLLDFTSARSVSGIPIVPTAANVFEVCKEVIAEFEATSSHRNIELTTTGSGDSDLDADRMAQVFSNLIGNAIAYGSVDQPIRVTLHAEDGHIDCEVRSYGEPIDPSVLPYLFDPFRRASQHKTSGTRGLGLGLYITKEIIRAHGGAITVTSTEADGTALRFTIPRGRASTTAASPPPTFHVAP